MLVRRLDLGRSLRPMAMTLMHQLSPWPWHWVPSPCYNITAPRRRLWYGRKLVTNNKRQEPHQ